MGVYLDETSAKSSIEALAQTHLEDDFEVVLLRRKPKDLVSKYVFFGLKVACEKSESFFDEIMKATACDVYLEVIESEVIEENKKAKDLFILQALVKVVKEEV